MPRDELDDRIQAKTDQGDQGGQYPAATVASAVIHAMEAYSSMKPPRRGRWNPCTPAARRAPGREPRSTHPVPGPIARMDRRTRLPDRYPGAGDPMDLPCTSDGPRVYLGARARTLSRRNPVDVTLRIAIGRGSTGRAGGAAQLGPD